MRHGLAVVLLGIALAGAVARPWRLPAWVAPIGAAAVALLTGVVTWHAARVTTRPLASPLAFVALAVSNLTNLIAASKLSLTSTDFLTNLALPSVAASTVGWFVYRRVFPERVAVDERGPALDRRVLAIGGSAIALFLVLLVADGQAGVPAWVAALVAVGSLLVFTRAFPWRRVPVGTIVLALGLAVVAAGVATAFPHL